MEEDRVDYEESEYIPPRPGVLLIVCSVLVIAGCIFLFSSVIGEIASDRNPLTWMGSIILSLLFSSLGLSQYCATFRRSSQVARLVSILLLTVGGVLSFSFLASIIQGVILGNGLHYSGISLFHLLLAAVFFLVAGNLTRQWAQNPIRDSEIAPADGGQQWQISTRELFLATAIVAVISALATYFIRSG